MSALLRFAVRSFSTNSRPALRAARLRRPSSAGSTTAGLASMAGGKHHGPDPSLGRPRGGADMPRRLPRFERQDLKWLVVVLSLLVILAVLLAFSVPALVRFMFWFADHLCVDSC
jgi:hypothetical protein